MEKQLIKLVLTQIEIYVKLIDKCTSDQQELIEHYGKMIDKLTTLYERISEE